MKYSNSKENVHQYIFEALKQFVKQLRNFDRRCQEVDLDQAFNEEAEGRQLARFNIYDVLHHPEKLTAYYLLDEIEKMLGQSVISVVQHNK